MARSVDNPFGGFLPRGKDLQEAKKLTREQFEEIANKYLFMTFHDLQNALKNAKSLPAIDFLVMSLIANAIKDGDQNRINFLLDRLIGQVVKKIRIETTVDQGIPIEMSREEKMKMLEEYRSTIEREAEIVDTEE
jgi:hypothetical protein